nr:hypothetical protein [Salinicoccus roseus]
MNISSLTGISSLGGLTAYSASKGAIRTGEELIIDGGQTIKE